MSLDVKGLTFSYGSTPLLQDVSFTAPRGALTVLLGRNGCGKSTLLRVIAGIAHLQKGSVTVSGKELATLSGSARASLIGYLPQFHQTVFPFTVMDVVLTGRAAYVLTTPSERDREKAWRAMSTLGIEQFADRPYTELSGGERQMVMIARVLAQNPDVILLDEPASHLDLANQQRLLGILRQITASGVTVVAVLHDPNMAFLHADQVVFLRGGKIITPADPDAPWNPEFMKEIYGIATTVLPYQEKGIVVPLNEDGGSHGI